MKTKKHPNFLKHLLQWGVLAAIVGTMLHARWTEQPVDVEAYCPFGGLEALSTYLQRHSLACSMSMLQIMMGIVLGVGVILFSKLFCGYLCPLGTAGEWLGKLGRRFGVQADLRSGSAVDRLLRVVKYVLLFVVFYYTVSSSELFCKRFDPYYALATGFKGEIVFWMACTSVVLLFLGSVFVRMFWCRYICPLGAVSHLFKFTPFFVIVLAGTWLLGYLGVANGWVWALAVACGGSYLIEVIKLRSCFFPLLAVTRDEHDCNLCGACEKKCPYHIDIHHFDKVRHVDCTLCGQCISTCATGALQVNRRRSLRWLPGVLAVVLFIFALIFGNRWELPTIDEKWGDYEKVEHLETFSMDGLLSVKCFGSSKALAAKMQTVPGVYGLRTFVRRHGVEILYDPAVTNDRKLQESLFSPTIRKYETPDETVPVLQVLELGVEGLRDKMDMSHFGLLFFGREGFYGFTSEFDCPVRVRLYVDPALALDEKALREIVEVEEYAFPNAKKEVKPIPMHFELKSFRLGDTVSRRSFAETMFADVEKLKGRFVENLERWGDSIQYPRAIYELPMAGIEKMPVRMGFPYFKSFLSTREGILSVDFVLRDCSPALRLHYVSTMWTPDRIWNEIFKAEKWTLRMADGTFQESEPRIAFLIEGRTVEE